MRKYRLVEIAVDGDTIYAVERKVLGMFWVQVDRCNNILLVNRAEFGIYDDKDAAEGAMEAFIDEENLRHAVEHNRRVI